MISDLHTSLKILVSLKNTEDGCVGIDGPLETFRVVVRVFYSKTLVMRALMRS